MRDIYFEWDDTKSRNNKRKHGVSFDEAQTVFFDENAIRDYDPDYSEDEDRFIMLGMSFTLRVLVVCHCYRSDDKVIRIISARRATKEKQPFTGGDLMRAQYDFSKMKGEKNPYVKHLKQPVTIRLDKSFGRVFESHGKRDGNALSKPY